MQSARRPCSMALNFPREELAFRREVRAFIEANGPQDARGRGLEGQEVSRDDTVRWQQILHRRGWGGPNWPQQFGGTGWDPVQQYIFEEESAAAGAPRLLPFGLKMVGPGLMRVCQPEDQKALPPPL